MVKINIAMPKNCACCPMSWTENGYEYYCSYTRKESYFGTGEDECRPNDCPWIEVED